MNLLSKYENLLKAVMNIYSFFVTIRHIFS
nr:MAG TPA: hypothetical protein [Caudoviricetes sp.]